MHQVHKDATPPESERVTSSMRRLTLSKSDELLLQPVFELVLSVVVLGASGDLGGKAYRWNRGLCHLLTVTDVVSCDLLAGAI